MSQFKSIRRVGGIIALATFAFAFSALAAPRLALDSPSVDFGEVAANAALVREVHVGNAGGSDPGEYVAVNMSLRDKSWL